MADESDLESGGEDLSHRVDLGSKADEIGIRLKESYPDCNSETETGHAHHQRHDHDGSISTLTSLGRSGRLTFRKRESDDMADMVLDVLFCFVIYVIALPILLALSLPLLLLASPFLAAYYSFAKEPKPLQTLLFGQASSQCDRDAVKSEGEDVRMTKQDIAEQLIRRRCLGIMEYHKDADDEASDDESNVANNLAWSRPIGGIADSVPRDFQGRIHFRLASRRVGETTVLSCLVFSEPISGDVSVSSLQAPLHNRDDNHHLSADDSSEFVVMDLDDPMLQEILARTAESTAPKKAVDGDEAMANVSDYASESANFSIVDLETPEQARVNVGDDDGDTAKKSDVNSCAECPETTPATVVKEKKKTKRRAKVSKIKSKEQHISRRPDEDSSESEIRKMHSSAVDSPWLCPKNTLCDICMNPFGDNEVAVWSPFDHCKHTFHQKCILVDLLDDPKCPQCKLDFIKNKSTQQRQEGHPEDLDLKSEHTRN